MLRFNDPESFPTEDFFVFQYILCYGSTGLIYQIILGGIEFQYILCYGSTLALMHFIFLIISNSCCSLNVFYYFFQ